MCLRLNITDTESVSQFLQNCADIWKHKSEYQELDTIERIIIPVLAALGWNVGIDSSDPVVLLRGNRSNKGKKRFDLSFYDNGILRIALECKAISASFKTKDYFKTGKLSDLSSVKQLIGYCTSEYGFAERQTIPVWTNGKLWVVFKCVVSNTNRDDVFKENMRRKCEVINNRQKDHLIEDDDFVAVRLLKRGGKYSVSQALDGLGKLNTLIGHTAVTSS